MYHDGQNNYIMLFVLSESETEINPNNRKEQFSISSCIVSCIVGAAEISLFLCLHRVTGTRDKLHEKNESSDRTRISKDSEAAHRHNTAQSESKNSRFAIFPRSPVVRELDSLSLACAFVSHSLDPTFTAQEDTCQQHSTSQSGSLERTSLAATQFSKRSNRLREAVASSCSSSFRSVFLIPLRSNQVPAPFLDVFVGA